MYWYLKMLSFYFLLLTASLSCQSSHVLTTWVLLELSTLGFIFMLALDSSFFESFQELMKLFLIQALSGVFLLLLIMAREMDFSFFIPMLITLVILFKMGAAPFQFWLISLSNSLSWVSLYLLLTLQKFIPLQIMSSYSSNPHLVITLLAFIVSGSLSFLLSNLKQLVVVSSLFFLGMLLTTLGLSMFWVELLVIYSLVFFPMAFFFSVSLKEDAMPGLEFYLNMKSMAVFVMMVSLSGLPPSPGFLMKYLWLITTELSSLLMLLFTTVSGLMTYLYLSVAFSSISSYENHFLPTGLSSASPFSLPIFWVLMSFFISLICIF